MFTLTIADKPIAVTNATEDEAEELFMSDDFRHDLQTLETDGAPLWDGIIPLRIRPALDHEVEEFEGAGHDEGNDTDKLEDEGGPLILFLVDITDPDGSDDE